MAREGPRATPAPGPTRSIGAHGNGCIAGAVQLPAEGPGWQAVRLSRNRRWGHPVTIRWIGQFAGQARAAGFADLWIGDLGQPRGGRMPSGHASHQTGLDADIWLDLRPKPPSAGAARESIDVPSLVLPGQGPAGGGLDPSRWSERYATLIALAARQPGVDRIFVNPSIKQGLCAAHRGEAWLRLVRPWYGHDSHMHVRLRCPAGEAECQGQAPVPAGDGCDASLDWWFSEEAKHPPPRTGPPPRPPEPPAACRAVFRAP